MTEKSTIAAQRREQVVGRYAARRAELEEAVRVRALSRLPRGASPVRLRDRDQVDGRPRGYLRKAGVSRITFRAMARRGELPGITESSR